MWTKTLTGRLLLAAVLLISAQGTAWAQATRTWVSGVGDDANPCSRTAPCKTFAGAISKTQAKGVISVLDPGGYGGVTITKAITIDGSAVSGSLLVSGVNGINVTAAAADVVRIRHVSLEGISGGVSGIRFNSGSALLLDDVRIHDFTSHGIQFAPSGSSRLVVSDSVITNNQGNGIYVQPGASGFARVSLDNVKLNNNNQNGFYAEDRTVASIRNSFLSHNGNNGVLAFSVSQPVEINVDSSQVTNNGLNSTSAAGVRSQGALASIIISGNVISENPRGILAAGGADIFSFGSNRVSSNTLDGSPTGVLTTR
jgi:hypothetical protein